MRWPRPTIAVSAPWWRLLLVLTLAWPALIPRVVAQEEERVDPGRRSAPVPEDAEAVMAEAEADAEVDADAAGAPRSDGSPAPRRGPTEAADAAAEVDPAAASAPPAPLTFSRPTGDEGDEEDAIRYLLEGVEIVGNAATQRHVIRGFVTLDAGDVLDVDDPSLQAIRWRLLGTGWFDEVALSLRRGSGRGRVILVVRVSERNTLVLRQLVFGVSQGLRGTGDETPKVAPYLGLSIAERNLFGQGLSLGATTLVSALQWGVNIDLIDPFLFGSRVSFQANLFLNDALEFFGDDPLVAVRPEDDDIEAENAVVDYRRYGLSLGGGLEVSRFSRIEVDVQTELVDVGRLPAAASERRGDETVPIEFSILDGRSVLSMLRFRLIFDRRDDPVRPTRGTGVRVAADLGNRVFGSDYDFLRLQGSLSQSIPLSLGSSFHIRLFGGIVFGEAPFFLQFYIADLTDLIPSRVLEMNIDRRPAPNILGTAISEQRIEEVAGRLDFEYVFPLFRGEWGALRAVDAYLGAGLYALVSRQNLRVAIPGFDGASRIPVDLTFDLGLRIDTEVGLVKLGLSTVVGFLEP